MSFLHEDLDAVEEGFAGLRGPLKAQLCGPWTLAAAVELRSGERAVRDPGAVRELGEALAEVARAHVADLARRLPGGQIVLSIDEPSLPAVRAGRLPTASGWGRLRAVPDAEVTETLSGVLAAVAAAGALPAVHCCAADAPVGLFVTAGARAVSVDLGVLGQRVQDDVAAAVEAGVGLLAGVVPTDADEAALRGLPVAVVVDRLTAWWHRLGFPPETLAQQVSVSPACGLAGTTPTAARAILGRVAAVARAVRDEETPAP